MEIYFPKGYIYEKADKFTSAYVYADCPCLMRRRGREQKCRKHRVGGNDNVFSTDGCVLAPITWYHVVRHVALRSDMNPYLDGEYFEERQSMLRRRRSKSFRMPAPVG